MNLPFNVQRRTLSARHLGPCYIAWNAAGSTFNVRQDRASRLWHATATTYDRALTAPTLSALAARLDDDHTCAARFGAQASLMSADLATLVA